MLAAAELSGRYISDPFLPAGSALPFSPWERGINPLSARAFSSLTAHKKIVIPYRKASLSVTLFTVMTIGSLSGKKQTKTA